MTREPLRPTTDSQRRMIQAAVDEYHDQLWDSSEAQEHLEERGIDPDTASTFRLGVVTDPQPGHERYEGMLCIPYARAAGGYSTMRFRCIEDHTHQGHGKYMSLPHDPGRLFNVSAIRDAGSVIGVCEGEMDTITLAQCEVPAIGLPGATTWTYHYGHVLAGFERVLLFGDPDDAGLKFNAQIMRAVSRARIVPLRDGDVSETYRLGGSEAIHQLIKEALK